MICALVLFGARYWYYEKSWNLELDAVVGITLENIREKRFAFCNEVLIKSGSEVVLCRKYWSAEHIAVPVV